MGKPLEVPNQIEKPKCALHATSRDNNWTTEDHHIIPQAWQAVFIPPNAQLTPAPPPTLLGEDIASRSLALPPRALWDPRTITLAPTCHRNVHFWLVQTLHRYAKVARDPSTPEPVRLEAAYTILQADFNLRGVQAREHGVATTGLSRYMSAGGSLDTLVDNNEWGQA